MNGWCGRSLARRGLQCLLGAMITTLIFARFLPANPTLPGDWLDSGWVWGTNHAFTHGLQFGRDIIFNYGPYSTVATQIYDPASRATMLGGSLILAVAFSTGILCLGRPVWALFAVLLLPLVGFSDSLAFGVALPAILTRAQDGIYSGHGVVRAIAVLAAVPALALLPLIKGSYIGISVIDTVILVVLVWQTGQRCLAASIIPAVLLLLVMLWRLAGQHLSSLPAFLYGTMEIISGHNYAMVTPGTYPALIDALLPSLAFLSLLVLRGRQLAPLILATLLFGLSGALFIVFKAGYVRADPGHEALTLVSLGWLLVILAVWLGGRLACCAGALGLILLFTGPFAGHGLRGRMLSLGGALAAEFHDGFYLLTDPVGRARVAAATLAHVEPLPWKPDGTADIYSYDQMHLIATGLTWDPRPMFQSYSAYTPWLAWRNEDHLLHDAAPTNVFFRVEPIDGRLPALEDGPSWIALQSLYDPVGYDGTSDLAWLRHVSGNPPLPKTTPLPFSETRRRGEQVQLPATGHDLWARLDITPTFAGRLAGLLWQAPLLHITLVFADGHTQSFRLVPGMAQAGFILSPVVSSTLDFLRLRALPHADRSTLMRPVALAVTSDDGGAWAWRKAFTLQLATFDLPPLRHDVPLKGVASPSPVAIPANAKQSMCNLDQVNGGAIPHTPIATTWPITMIGWSLFDLASKQQADKTTILFHGTDGTDYEMPALQGPRADIGSFFHLPDWDRTAFISKGDLTHLPPGDYAVLITSRHAGETRLCKTPLVVSVAATH